VFLLRLAGNVFLSLLDLAMGAFIVFVGSKVSEHDVSVYHYGIGALLAALPDLDVLYMFLRWGRVYGDHHQYLTHRPIIGISAALLIGMVLGGAFWAVTACACMLWHYIHDTKGLGGGGIAWLWPFSRLYYSLHGAENPEESIMLRDHHQGLDSEILSPSPKSVIESLMTSILLGIVGGSIWGIWAGFRISAAVCFTVLALWCLHARVGHRTK